MKTFVAKEQDVAKKWYVVDAKDRVLGRLATQIAMRLRGKHKPVFATHADTGDFVVVINADKVALTGKKWDKKIYYHHTALTGKKWDKKIYYHHTGYIGGLKQISAKKLLEKKPEDLLRFAVKGMLPKNSLGRRQLNKLKIYVGTDHPHEAQQPEVLEI
ncbi:MAG: 50S ribosomal protein L13 [Deltaproteobacteria bacterium]|nr:50S ribosomal protein L13 [Deltaproteobacteria bacterium]